MEVFQRERIMETPEFFKVRASRSWVTGLGFFIYTTGHTSTVQGYSETHLTMHAKVLG